MARLTHLVAAILTSASFLSAQALSFEVASVKPNISGSSAAATSAPLQGTIQVLNTPARMLIVNAYGLKPFQVVGAPAWLDSERYDIIAKPPDKTPPNMIPLMFRTLLEDRFKLKVHMETREQPIYELVVARDDERLGPGLVKSQTDCTAIDAARATGRDAQHFGERGPQTGWGSDRPHRSVRPPRAMSTGMQPATSFHELRVWQTAMDLVENIYVLSKEFPADERFGLTAQIRRAAVSIPSNIAEGQRRKRRKAFLHHLDIALGSQRRRLSGKC